MTTGLYGGNPSQLVEFLFNSISLLERVLSNYVVCHSNLNFNYVFNRFKIGSLHISISYIYFYWLMKKEQLYICGKLLYFESCFILFRSG